jgi:hypothetical protein
MTIATGDVGVILSNDLPVGAQPPNRQEARRTGKLG